MQIEVCKNCEKITYTDYKKVVKFYGICEACSPKNQVKESK